METHTLKAESYVPFTPAHVSLGLWLAESDHGIDSDILNPQITHFSLHFVQFIAAHGLRTDCVNSVSVSVNVV